MIPVRTGCGVVRVVKVVKYYVSCFIHAASRSSDHVYA